MDKLTAIKIKYEDGTYSDQIPVSVLGENVEWDATHTLVDILGSIDVDITGTIQDQITQLFNSKVNATDLSNYVNSTMKTEVASWLNNYISPATGTIAYDASLSIQGAAADAKAAGQIVQISTTKPTKENNRIWVGGSEEEYEVPTMDEFNQLKSHLTRSFAVKQVYKSFTKQSGKKWQYYDNFNLIDATGYFAISFDAEENQEYEIYARNIGTNTTFAIAYFAGTTLISSVSNLPTTSDHRAVVTTPSNCTSVRFTTNNESQPWIRVFENVYASKENAPLYVSLSGSDIWDGSKAHPYQSIQKAINDGSSDTIIIASGRYQTPISASGVKKLHLIGNVGGGTIIDYSTTLTPSAGASGVLESTYSSTADDPIYQVFVSKTLPLYTQANATAYTVNLWTFDGSTLIIPKLTLAEVQAEANTWTYDGTKIYINGTASAYKLVPTFEDIGGTFSDIQDLTIENVSFKFSGYTNCSISDCNNVTVEGCEFSNAGRQHGLAFSNSNAVVRKCLALQNCYDGFNIHNKGVVSFIDCESGYNRDDGMSHHDGSTGTVIGGKYHHNHKAGIAPTYDAKVDVYNTVCVANGYGIYYACATSPIDCIISNCALLANNGYGLRVNGTYDIQSFGTLYSDNNERSKADDGGSIYAIGGN